ncbi:MBL fold metallo-hydrolase, partial [Candidatus Aerophobetes bacterium]|nr:MBL fold metallo-hydrolase [Candidatus Aerophobetes bacterium]
VGGSSEKLYFSLFEKIGKLNENIKIYPGHDYGKKPFSTLGEEKRYNPYYQCRSMEEFVELRKRGVD